MQTSRSASTASASNVFYLRLMVDWRHAHLVNCIGLVQPLSA
jgi:hypothetical protein